MSDALSVIPSDWETVETVRRAARRNGRVLTDKQLHTAQQRGAIPRPRQVLRGRKGSLVFYPPGTSDQLRRYCALLDDGATVEEAMWLLWWDGHPIAEEHIRKRLNADVQLTGRVIAWHMALTSTSASERANTEELLLDASLKHYRSRPLMLLLSRARSEFPELVRVVAAVVTGDFVRFSTPNARALAATLGGTYVTHAGPIGTHGPTVDDDMMRRISAVFVQMFDTPIAGVSWERLLDARNECRLLWSVLPAFLADDGANVSPQVAELIRTAVASNVVLLQPFVLRVWLAARENPNVHNWFASLLAALDTARATARDVSEALRMSISSASI